MSSVVSSLMRRTTFVHSRCSHAQNSVHCRPTEMHWHFLLSLHSSSLQYRCVMSLTSRGAASYSTGSKQPSCPTLQPFPTGFHKRGFAMWLLHQIAVWYMALRTCCSNASSVGGIFVAALSVVEAMMYLSSSRVAQVLPWSFFLSIQEEGILSSTRKYFFQTFRES